MRNNRSIVINQRNFKSAESNVMDQVRGRGGTMTIDFRTDNVQSHLLKTLNKLADTGKLTKVTTIGGLVHTFTLSHPAEAE